MSELLKKIEVIEEATDYVVVNKPSGIIVHGDGKGREEATLADWVLEQYPETRGVGEPWVSPSGEVIERPGIVHRLDRETSGVMIIAKNQEMYLYLKELFQTRHVKKEYLALVYGFMKDDTGLIDKPIGRSPADFRRYSAQPGARGVMRDAVTRFEVISRGLALGHSFPKGKRESGDHVPISVVNLFPETGRTHQLRVHMKAIHYPIVCDSLYAEGKPGLVGLERVGLHAQRLTIPFLNGVEKTFEAQLPLDLEMVVGGVEQKI